MRYLRTKFLITQLGVVLLWQMKILENKKKKRKKEKKGKKEEHSSCQNLSYSVNSAPNQSDERLHAIDQLWRNRNRNPNTNCRIWRNPCKKGLIDFHGGEGAAADSLE